MSFVIDPFWLTLLGKMTLSALLVVAASVLVERTGPLIGAMIATLPISAGPNFVYLAIEHGPAFLAQAARVGLIVNVATGPLVVVYAALAQRHGLALSLSGAYAVWALGVALLVRVDFGLAGAVAANIVVYGLCMTAARRFLGGAPAARPARRWWDLPLRALAVMVLVCTVVLSGRLLGPSAAGIAALVPIVLTSLIVILHPRIGGAATARVLAMSLPGLVGFGAAIAGVSVAAIPLGSTGALTLGLAGAVIWNLALLALNRRRTAPALPPPALPR